MADFPGHALMLGAGAVSPVVTPPVVILCGGLGMRLREESEFKPKPMVEIGGRPILWHILRHYERHGFHRFILCLGYRGDKIREYFLDYEYMNNDVTIGIADGRRTVTVHPNPAEARPESWQVTLAETGALAMTGARIKRIEKYVDTPYFLATYGDGVSNVDINALVAFHQAHGKLATLTSITPTSRFGALDTKGDVVTSFMEKPEMVDNPVNGGFFVFNREVFDYLQDDESCVLEHGPFAKLASDGQMMTYRHPGYWQSMDTPRDVKLLNDEWRTGNPGWLGPSPARQVP